MRLQSMALILLCPCFATAHDYWLQPGEYSPKSNEKVSIHLFVGDHFKNGAERPFQMKPLIRFQLHSQSGVTDLSKTSNEAEKPVGEFTPKKTGTYLIGMERKYSFITLAPEKFNRYLKHEGLEHILADRAKRKEADKPGTERYSRHLKAIVHCGRGDTTWKKKLGHRLEIIPLTDPSDLKKGSTFPVQVLLHGKPLPNAAIFAYRKTEKKADEQALRTDQQGKTMVKINAPGLWMVRLVYMHRCPEPGKYDWESHWSSLTFGVQK